MPGVEIEFDTRAPVGLEARTARLADQHGVLAQPGRPLRWAAGLIALFAIRLVPARLRRLHEPVRPGDRRGRAAGARRCRRRRPLCAFPPPDAQRDRRAPRDRVRERRRDRAGPHRPRNARARLRHDLSRGSIRTGSSRLAATAPADRRSTSATGRTSRPRSQAGRPSASACSGRSTRHRSSDSSCPPARPTGRSTARSAAASGSAPRVPRPRPSGSRAAPTWSSSTRPAR